MNTTDHPPSAGARGNPALPPWPVLLKKLFIWGGFVSILYVTRDFFFTGFMTFMFCYLTLNIVGWGMSRLSPDREAPRTRRLLTVGVFGLVLLGVLVPCGVIIPHVLPQGERLVEWLSHISPAAETSRLVEDIVGPFQFRKAYGDPRAEAYQRAFQAFRRQADRGESLARELAGDAEARLRTEFESAKRHEVFQQWWDQSPTARFIRRQIDAGLGDGSDLAEWAERVVSSFLDVPVGLATAFLLSFFICIDFPRLHRGMRRLRDSWTRDVYDEVVPALSQLGQLVGRSLLAQGLVAACNAVMIFIALAILGVPHEVLLAFSVFVLCLVPTFGAIISWFLITALALFGPGGGPMLALKVTGAFAFVGFMESFVLGPRILGRIMELHPVLIIGILPVAQYFFGIWGMVLSTPVAVFLINHVILGKELPGIGQEDESAACNGDETPAVQRG